MKPCPCPTPRRIAHPHQESAYGQRFHDYETYKVVLQPYLCRCRTWHLTRNLDEELPTYLEPTPADIQRLQSLDNLAFRGLVDADVKKFGTPEDRIALRAPELSTRWRWALKGLLGTVQSQLSGEVEGDDMWRSKAFAYEDAIRTRLEECRALRRYHLDQNT